MEQFKNEPRGGDDRETASRADQESRERLLPLITAEESRAIESSGGEYRGFVERTDGSQGFEDILISRHRYYDGATRGLIEAFVATEAVNNEGGNELDTPGDIQGFSTLITRTLRSGDAVVLPQIISFSLRDFADARMDIESLRRIAREVHEHIVTHLTATKPAELQTQVELLLTSKGLRKRPQ